MYFQKLDQLDESYNIEHRLKSDFNCLIFLVNLLYRANDQDLSGLINDELESLNTITFDDEIEKLYIENSLKSIMQNLSRLSADDQKKYLLSYATERLGQLEDISKFTIYKNIEFSDPSVVQQMIDVRHEISANLNNLWTREEEVPYKKFKRKEESALVYKSWSSVNYPEKLKRDYVELVLKEIFEDEYSFYETHSSARMNLLTVSILQAAVVFIGLMVNLKNITPELFVYIMGPSLAVLIGGILITALTKSNINGNIFPMLQEEPSKLISNIDEELGEESTSIRKLVIYLRNHASKLDYHEVDDILDKIEYLHRQSKEGYEVEFDFSDETKMEEVAEEVIVQNQTAKQS